LKKVSVQLKERSYNILIGAGLIQESGRLLKRLGLCGAAVVITNKRLLHLYGKPLGTSLRKHGFGLRFITVPDSERAKSSGVATGILNKIASADHGGSVFLVALGGGVVGDLTGFIASIYKRGVPYVQIPTTLLAQVDSSIGGKTAIDLPSAKNLAGSFYQPKIVISDVSVLKSLPKRRLISAMAEIIKYGIIKDRKLFEYIETNCSKIQRGHKLALEHVITEASRIKAGIVSKDERDNKGLRIILNYGHTAGHAIEAASSYAGKYDHGESVSVGMLIAVDIAREMHIINLRDAGKMAALIKKCGLPSKVKGISLAKVYSSLLHDKKFTGGRNRFVLPVGIGKIKVVEGVPVNIIKQAISGHIA